jgi:8-oxo-dGTP pyrophosphatase MutT (NUDIX family)
VVEVVGAVIVDPGGRASVHRRGFDRALFPGCWDIPGGHVEEGEDTLEALAREVCEETGWRVDGVLADLGEVRWVGDDGLERRERDYLVAVTGDLNAPRLELPKHVEFAWVGADELDRLLEKRRPEELLVPEIVRRGIETAAEMRAKER